MAGADDNVEVRLYTITGDLFTTLYVEPGWTATDLMSMLECKFGYPPQSQQLFLQEGASDSCLTLVLSSFDKAQALFSAARNGHEEAARRLLSHIAFDHQEGLAMLAATSWDDASDGMSALNIAAFHGHSSACQALLETPHTTEELGDILLARTEVYGCTALHFAVRPSTRVEESARVMTCRVLLAAAPNEEVRVNMLAARDDVDRTVLHYASGVTLPMLVARNGDRTALGSESSCRVLLEAAPNEEGRLAMLMARGLSGYTALHCAARQGHEMVCRVLLGAGTVEAFCEMLAATDYEGRTAAQVAEGDDVRRILDSA